MTSYDPLHGPDEPASVPASVDSELKLTRRLLDKVAGANIHDHTEMLKAAVSLDHRMRSLVAALTAERGDGQ